MGAGIFGDVAGIATYRLYVVTSLDARGFQDNNLRDARQKGNRAIAEDFSLVARVDVTPIPWLQIGGSLYVGNQGHNREFAGSKPDVLMVFWEAHVTATYKGLHLRAFGTMAHIDDTDLLSQELGLPISERLWGWYGEAAYDVLPLFFPGTRMALSPFVRYERFDTQADVPDGFTPNENRNVQIVTIGVNVWIHPNVVIKLDYRDFDSQDGDALQDDFNIGFGYAF